MSKNEKSKYFSEKSCRNRVVTKMLRKSFFDEKKRDDNFFMFCGNSLNIISFSILWQQIQQKLSLF